MVSPIDLRIDALLSITSLFDRYSIPYRIHGAFRCPFHPDNKPSCQLMGNHVFCHAEKRSYYPSNVLKVFSPVDYKAAIKVVLQKYKNWEIAGKRKDDSGRSSKEYDFSSLACFRGGSCGFDVVLWFIREAEL